MRRINDPVRYWRADEQTKLGIVEIQILFDLNANDCEDGPNRETYGKCNGGKPKRAALVCFVDASHARHERALGSECIHLRVRTLSLVLTGRIDADQWRVGRPRNSMTIGIVVMTWALDCQSRCSMTCNLTT